METVYVAHIGEIKKLKDKLEEFLKVKIFIVGKKLTFSGDAIDEYDACLVFEAISFGFKIKDALKLKNEDFMLRRIHIRNYTKRDLEVIKSRLIGTKGKTRRTIEEITNCKILVKEADIGIIADCEDIEHIATAIVNIIRGTKQSNMYQYLEKINRIRKEEQNDLGLKIN